MTSSMDTPGSLSTALFRHTTWRRVLSRSRQNPNSFFLLKKNFSPNEDYDTSHKAPPLHCDLLRTGTSGRKGQEVGDDAEVGLVSLVSLVSFNY